MLIFTGKTASGKTTVLKALERKGCYKRIITYTTRPPRSNEENGVDYNFVSDDVFQMLEQHGYFAETSSYCASSGKRYRYGSPLHLYNTTYGMVALDVNGVIHLRENHHTQDVQDLLIIYLRVPEELLMQRLRYRGDSEKEIQQRMDHDREAFRDIRSYCDLVIEVGEKDTVDDVVGAVEKAVANAAF